MNTATGLQGLPPDLQAALATFSSKPSDVVAAINAGSLLHNYGMHEQAGRLRAHVVDLMRHAVSKDVPPDILCALLVNLYTSFVKKGETETLTRECFQSWLPVVSAYGRKFQDAELPKPLWEPRTTRPWRPAFFLHQAVILGHTEALMELLAHRPRGLPWGDPVIYAFNGKLPALDKWAAEQGVEMVNLQDEAPDETQTLHKLQLLRRRIAQDGVSHLIWVSAPAMADFALPMRLAPAQVFWTLKFHPFRIPEIDGYITYGAWSEATRVVHGEEWQVVPFMMSKPSPPVPEDVVAKTRAPFKRHDILFGTLARTEKLNSKPFLDAVVRILRDNPHAGYLWTGVNRHAGIQLHFERAGVADRCHFIGWVQTPVYARALDVFLESFPFGCGLTGIQALEAGTAFVSFEAPETQYGMHFMRPLQENGPAAAEIRRLLEPDANRAPLIYTRDVDAYVAAANRLARDAEFRAAVGRAGQDYYRQYLTNSAAMAERFYAVLADVKVPQEGES